MDRRASYLDGPATNLPLPSTPSDLPTPDDPNTRLTQIPKPRISTTNDMRLLSEYNKKYLGHTDYDTNAAALGKSFYDLYLSYFAVGNDNTTTDIPSHRPPTPHTLLRSSFRRPGSSHSFHQEACFETAYVIVLKAGFFEPLDIINLHECHPRPLLALAVRTPLLHHTTAYPRETWKKGSPDIRRLSQVRLGLAPHQLNDIHPTRLRTQMRIWVGARRHTRPRIQPANIVSQ